MVKFFFRIKNKKKLTFMKYHLNNYKIKVISSRVSHRQQAVNSLLYYIYKSGEWNLLGDPNVQLPKAFNGCRYRKKRR